MGNRAFGMRKCDRLSDPVAYVGKYTKMAVDNIVKIAKEGMPEDAVRLKANSVLLNKIVPDQTKVEMDMGKMAPYELFMKKVGKGKE
jgi:hypothetical protein